MSPEDRSTIHGRTLLVLLVVFVLFTGIVLNSMAENESEKVFIQKLSLHQRIDQEQVESIRMGKVPNIHSMSENEGVELQHEQRQDMIDIFNSITQSSIHSADITDLNSLNVYSEMVIKLKNNSKIRVQYDRKNIYVTSGEVVYVVTDSKLKKALEVEYSS